jgi:hypothetical protein
VVILQFLHGLIAQVQVLLDSADGDGTDSPQMGEQSMNGVATGAEWLTWTELVPDEETIANCWTEIIDVESGDERTLFQTTRFEPLAPTTLQPRGPHADYQAAGFSLALEELCYFLECCWGN